MAKTSGSEAFALEYGEGTIWQHFNSEGEFLYWRFSKFEDVHGERKRITATSKQVNKAKAYVEASQRFHKNLERARGSTPAVRGRAGLSLEEYSKHWLQERSQGKEALSETQQRKYRQMLSSHVWAEVCEETGKPFGEMAIGAITTGQVRKLFTLNLWDKEGDNGEQLLGTHARYNVLAVLRQVFKHSINHEEPPLRSNNPVLSEFAPKNTRGDATEIETVPQRVKLALSMLRKESEGDAFTYVWLLMNFVIGLRRGERGGALWSNVVNLTKPGEARLKVRTQYVWDAGVGYHLKDTLKTSHGRRDIPLDEDFRKALLSWQKQQKQWQKQHGWEFEEGQDFILTHENGKPYTGNDDTQFWHDYRESFFTAEKDRHHREKWRGHLNRWICATLLHLNGIGLEQAKMVLGHGSAEMSRYYTVSSYKAIQHPMLKMGEWRTLTPKQQKELEVEARKFTDGAKAQA